MEHSNGTCGGCYWKELYSFEDIAAKLTMSSKHISSDGHTKRETTRQSCECNISSVL